MPQIAQEFNALVQRTETCWLWVGPRVRWNYGAFWLKGAPESYAHRMSWHLHFGPIPEGMKVLHKCDNPPCVRPDHLFLGDDLVNMRDKLHKGRSQSLKLTFADVVEIRRLYQTGNYSYTDLGVMFEVSRMQISYVVRQLGWKQLWGAPNIRQVAQQAIETISRQINFV